MFNFIQQKGYCIKNNVNWRITTEKPSLTKFFEKYEKSGHNNIR